MIERMNEGLNHMNQAQKSHETGFYSGLLSVMIQRRVAY